MNRETREGSTFQNGDNVVFAHHQDFLAIHLDFGSGIFAEEDLVAGLDTQCTNLTVIQDLAVASSHNLTAYRLLCRGIGNHDSARGGSLLFQALDDDTVVLRANIH